MPKFYSNKNIIEVSFPDKIFEFYLRKLSLESEDKFNDVNIFEIVKICYKDFKRGSLSLDDFSSIGGYLFNKLTSSSRSRSLGGVLLDIGELNFYIRNSDSKQKFIDVDTILSNVDEFFEKYKD